jgi:hypothetical protein
MLSVQAAGKLTPSNLAGSPKQTTRQALPDGRLRAPQSAPPGAQPCYAKYITVIRFAKQLCAANRKTRPDDCLVYLYLIDIHGYFNDLATMIFTHFRRTQSPTG